MDTGGRATPALPVRKPASAHSLPPVRLHPLAQLGAQGFGLRADGGGDGEARGLGYLLGHQERQEILDEARAALAGGAHLDLGHHVHLRLVTTPEQGPLYYVGRTGDSSSSHAQSPFDRMGKHLGSNDRNNMLSRYLGANRLAPEKCGFRLVAHGPLFEEATGDGHHEPRDITAALESALACAMKQVGYEPINTVRCNKPVDEERFAAVRSAFAVHFEKLANWRETGGDQLRPHQ